MPLAVVALRGIGAGLAGCGSPAKDSSSDLRFEHLSPNTPQGEDTTGLHEGTALLGEFTPYRSSGAIHVRGRLRLPDGAKLQLTVYRPKQTPIVARTQFTLEGGHFDSPALLGPRRQPLPVERYRFVLVVFFDDVWQPPSVLAATRNGRTLRGPGMTRDRNGGAAFVHSEERSL